MCTFHKINVKMENPISDSPKYEQLNMRQPPRIHLTNSRRYRNAINQISSQDSRRSLLDVNLNF